MKITLEFLLLKSSKLGNLLFLKMSSSNHESILFVFINHIHFGRLLEYFSDFSVFLLKS